MNRTVAIIGRPNVGKSTLFNRLIGRRKAIETPVAGTTRDRLYGEVFWCNQTIELVDVAGIEYGTKNEITKSAQEGVQLAIDNADLLLFVVDWTEKDNEIDKSIARSLRKINKPVLLVINKADNLDRQRDVEEFNRLGNFEMIPISAISGKSTGDLLDLICARLNQLPNADTQKLDKSNQEELINLAILGRPNVGKSTLLNAIVGEKRAITSPVAGTTRDTFDVKFDHKGKRIRIVDTAGIRRPGKIEKDTIESFSVLRSWQALKEADVVVVVVDNSEGMVAGDTHLLGEAIETGKGVILAVNKIDLWQGSREEAMAMELNLLQRKLNFAPWLPVVFISAEKDENIKPLLNQVVAVYKNRQTVIDQPDLDQILDFAKNANQQLLDITSLRQKKTNPPVFEVKYKGKTKPHYTQIRYLENKIRDAFPMEGSPIFLDLSHRA